MQRKKFWQLVKWGSMSVLLVWMIGALVFVMLLPKEVVHFDRNTDAIVVLTGEVGRVPTGFRLLEEKRAQALFISGVGANVRLKDIAPDLAPDIRAKVTIGGLAKDTMGNAAETAWWVKKHGYRSIRLVTSYDHMPRSLVEFYHCLPGIEIIPHPVVPEGNDTQFLVLLQNWRRILREYNKYILALGRTWWEQ